MKSGLLRIALEGFDEDAPWVGFDLDGTVAHYDGWKGIQHIGAPIAAMIELIKKYLDEGVEVRIFTARASQSSERETNQAILFIEEWCQQHIGRVLRVTNVKDNKMIKLYDDRAVTVVENEGKVIEAKN